MTDEILGAEITESLVEPFLAEEELRTLIMARAGFNIGPRLLDQVVRRVEDMDHRVRRNLEMWLQGEWLAGPIPYPDAVPVQDYTSARSENDEWYTEFKMGALRDCGRPFPLGMISPRALRLSSVPNLVFGFIVVDTLVQGVLDEDRDRIREICESQDPQALVLSAMAWEYSEFRSLN